jgi:hypothetical protein
MTEQTEGSGPSELELLKNRARLLGIEFSNNIGIETLRERVNEKLSEIEDDSGKDTLPAVASGSESDANIPEVVDTDQGDQGSDFDAGIEEETITETADQQEANGLTAAAQIAAAKVTAPPVTPIQPIAPKIVNTPDPSISAKAGQATEAKPGKTLSLRQRLYNEQMKLVRLNITNLDPKKADLQGELLAVGNKFIGTVKMFVPYGEVTDDGWHVPYIIYKELERRKFLSIRTTKDRRTGQVKVSKSWAKEFSLTILPPLSEEELKRLAVAQAAAGSIDAPSEVLG